MKTLYVLFDSDCGFCIRCIRWLSKQPKFIPMKYFPRAAAIVNEKFPNIIDPQKLDEMIVIADDGAVYRGTSAYIICLYALRNYREWALRLTSPILKPLARIAFSKIAQNRLRISRWFNLSTDNCLATELRTSHIHTTCDHSTCPTPTNLIPKTPDYSHLIDPYPPRSATPSRLKPLRLIFLIALALVLLFLISDIIIRAIILIILVGTLWPHQNPHQPSNQTLEALNQHLNKKESVP